MAWVTVLALSGCGFSISERAVRSNGMGRVSVADIDGLGLRQIEGKVKYVDPSTGIVVIEQSSGDVRLHTSPDTSFFVAGAKAALKDLREGALVRASFSLDGVRKLASWIEIPRDETPPTPPSPPEKKPVQAAPVPVPEGGAAP
ncbi:hypothetical protein AKJ08_0742 [Vulgatibacter incomptus]|uniref:Uncharacterized protein n=2 Tax=Vulgatibacter incomptus TaxID=1391653 RepID=A0A0K1PA13_9BACT|nr:hypothetical protein AKJ08_0742 [Vulgatibacter incomptus]